MEAPKPWYLSKTLWFNFITGVLAVLALTQFQDIIPPTWGKYIAFVNAVGNVILRLITTQPIKT